MAVVSPAFSNASTAGNPVLHWRIVRKLYPTYASLIECLGLGDALPKPPADMSDSSDPAAAAEISRWVEDVDRKIQAHHLRQFLQQTDLASSEDTLHALIDQLLGKEPKTDCDRDKLDYLLVQFFAASAPPSFQAGGVTREQVAEVLEPVLGSCSADLPDWLEPLDQVRFRLEKCESARELWEQQLISRGRELKAAAGQAYFEPKALIAFAHFNCCLRRELARIMNSDLRFVGESLDKLQARGVEFIDCRSAGLSEREPIASLKKRWESWEIPLEARDSKDGFLTPLLNLRKSVEEALRPFGGSELDHICENVAQLRKSLASITGQMKKVTAEIRRQAIAPPKETSAGIAAVSVIVEKAAVVAIEPSETAAPTNGFEGATEAGVETCGGVDASAQEAESCDPAADETSEMEALPEAAPVVVFDVEERVLKVKEALSATVRRKSAISLAAGGTRVLLTPSEVGAFLERGDEVTHAVRRAVALRLALVEALETYKQERSTSNLPLLVKLARTEYDQAQGLIAKCRGAKKDEPADSVAASSRQLVAMLQRGEKLLS